MRIAIFLPLYPPRWQGGTEIATRELAQGLCRRGHEVTVITMRARGELSHSSEGSCHVYRAGDAEIPVLGLIVLWIRAVLFIRENKPDLVHVQKIGNCLPAFAAKFLFGTPYVVWARGADAYFNWRMKKLFARTFLKHADSVIALTEDMKHAVQRIYNRDVVVLPNGVDTRLINESRSFPKSTTRLSLLYVGSLRPVKGVDTLIYAMNEVTRSIEHVSLVIIGNGRMREMLQELTARQGLGDRVSFKGEMSNSEVQEHMNSSSLLILPSHSEGFPVVVLEAMVAGLPIVATNVNGMGEIVTQNENGILVNPGEPKELADAITTLLKNPSLRERMSKNNLAKSRQFDWTAIIAQLERVYADSIRDS